MANFAQYAATPKIGLATVSSANTNRDGTGTLATVLAAGANGTRIDLVNLQATGTTTAGMIRLFLHDGTNTKLISETPVSVLTPSGSAAAWASVVRYPEGLIIPTGWSLKAATNNAESFNIIARGGDL